MLAHLMDVSWILWTLVAAGAATPCADPDARPMASGVTVHEKAAGPCMTAYDPELRPTLELLWERSATYRRQCMHLARNGATVSFRIESAKSARRLRAVSTIGRRADGSLVMFTRIGRGYPFAELVAHELEHAVEFSEGLQFPARVANGGGWRLQGGEFETQRAIDAGRQAKSEVGAAPWREPSARAMASPAVPEPGDPDVRLETGCRP